MSATRKAIDQVNKYSAELRKADEELSKLKKGTKEYNAAMKRHEQAYNKGKTSVRQLRVELTKLSTNFKSHRKLITDGGSAMSGWNDNASKATKSTKRLGGGLKGAIGTLVKYGIAFQAINLVIKAFKFFTVDAVSKAAEFEKGVANLSAVAGVGGEKLQLLKDAALDVAGQTKFTANEIITLQTELSKLGFSAEDVVAATSSIAFGAQALGESLETVASQVGKIVNQFNLLAEESSLVVDTIVTTINESALSLNTFSTAIQYVGPLAAGLGFNLQETAGAMAILADNGFTASRVGTGLRGIFTELGTETIDVKAKLRQLAEENLSLSEAVDLVGKRNAAQLITLVDNVDALELAEEKYYSQGRAIEAAAKQANTFAGNMDILKSAIDRYQIGIGGSIIDTGIFRNALALLAPEAAKIAEGFRVIEGIGAKAFGEDLKDIVLNNADVTEIAIRRVAEANKMSVEEVTKKFEDSKPRLVKVGDQYGNYIEVVRESSNKASLAVKGLIKQYEDLAEQERKNLIISDARKNVQEEYQEILDDLILREQLGENIISDADSFANEVKEKMRTLKGEVEDAEYAIEQSRGSSYAKQVEDVKLAKEAELKELQNFYRLLANLVGIEISDSKEAEKITRRKADNFSDLVDAYDDYKESIERTSELLELENESNEKFLENTDERIRLNKELKDTNNELITQLENEISVRQIAIGLEDETTKQGAYNISMYEKEVEALNKLIQKYYDQNDALNSNVDTIKLAQGNFKKQLSELEKDYDRGDIGTKAFTERREQLLNDFRAQLNAIAAGDPEMEKAVTALFGKIQGDIESPIDWRDLIAGGLDEAIDTVSGIIETFGDTAFDNLKNRLEAEKQLLKDRYETEDYLAKQQFENGLINESQYRRRQQQLRKKQVAEENAIDKKLFEAQNQRDKSKARTDYLESIASIIPELIKAGKVIPTDLAITSAITAALATASYSSELGAINQRQFVPKKFAEGGIVNGPSHSQGGVPFTVRGRSGYEMEGGEFIVNKRASSLHRDLLERINGSIKPNVPSQPMKFAQGGIVTNSVTNVSQETRETVNYLKAIAEATTTNAINSSKPVKAFVTSADLRTDATARRIKDNNTTI